MQSMMLSASEIPTWSSPTLSICKMRIPHSGDDGFVASQEDPHARLYAFASQRCLWGLQAEYEVISGSAKAPPSPAQSTLSNGLPGLATEAVSAADPQSNLIQRQKDSENGVHDSFLQDALKLQQMRAAKANKKVCAYLCCCSILNCRYTLQIAPIECTHFLLRLLS